jgi:hypothetical protein
MHAYDFILVLLSFVYAALAVQPDSRPHQGCPTPIIDGRAAADLVTR